MAYPDSQELMALMVPISCNNNYLIADLIKCISVIVDHVILIPS